eukprot:4908263-Amphidinium_carterae.1
MGKRDRSVVLTPATAERSATLRPGRHSSRSPKRAHRRVRRSIRRVHKHEKSTRRRAAALVGEQRSRRAKHDSAELRRGAATDGEQRSMRQKHSRVKQRKLKPSHKARSETSPSGEGYSSDDESYYSESDDPDPTAKPSGATTGESKGAVRRPYPFATPAALAMASEGQQQQVATASHTALAAPAAEERAEAAERRVELSIATQSVAGSRLSENEARGSETPYRQASAHE